MCLHAGFSLSSANEHWWCHGQSTQGDFIYVTPSILSQAQLARLSDEVGSNRSLLVFCAAFTGDPYQFENLTIHKIPKTVLNKCDWAIDDYKLKNKLSSRPQASHRSVKATVAAKKISEKRKKR